MGRLWHKEDFLLMCWNQKCHNFFLSSCMDSRKWRYGSRSRRSRNIFFCTGLGSKSWGESLQNQLWQDIWSHSVVALHSHMLITALRLWATSKFSINKFSVIFSVRGNTVHFHWYHLYATDVVDRDKVLNCWGFPLIHVPPQCAHTCARHVSGTAPLADFYDLVRRVHSSQLMNAGVRLILN